MDTSQAGGPDETEAVSDTGAVGRATASAEPLPPMQVDWTRHFTAGRLLWLLVGLLFVQYPEVVLGTHSFFDRDYGLFTYPIAHYTHEAFWRGEVPLWNPLLNCGAPFLAQWNTTVCYPPAWLYVLFPLPWSLSYFCLGHLVFAGLTMYWLAHRWSGNRFAASVAAVAYALNGLSFNCLMWTSNLAALSWMPLVILWVERAWQEGGRRSLLAAVAGAMQMLSGAPEIILTTWGLLGTLWVLEGLGSKLAWKRAAGRVGLVVLLICVLAAVQLLPFFELLHSSSRTAGQDTSAWPMPAWGWANFLVPLFRCERSLLGTYFQTDQQWTSSYYLGIGITGLALLAVFKVRSARVFWLAAAALLGMTLALGEHGFLYGALTRLIPPLALARYPIKFLMPTVFAVPMLAALAAAWLCQEGRDQDRGAHRSLWGVTALLLVGVALIVGLARYFPFPNESWRVTGLNGLERGLCLLLLVGGLRLLVRATTPARRAGLGFAVLLLLGLDAVTHMPRQNPTVPNSVYGPAELPMSAPPRLGLSREMLNPRMETLFHQTSTTNPVTAYLGMRAEQFLDCNLLDGAPKVTGFYSLYLRDEADVRGLLSKPDHFPAGWADFLGVSQISSPDRLFQWSARDTFLPWITGGQRPVFAPREAALTALGSKQFEPRRAVYLPPEAQGLIGATNLTEVKFSRQVFSAQKVEVVTEAAQPALVVVAQAYYPAWKAYVDDRPVRLWRANVAFQALEVPPGTHRVTLRYEDRAFQVGLILSALGVGTILVLGLRGRFRATGALDKH